MRKVFQALRRRRRVGRMAADAPCTLQLHIDHGRDEPDAEVARRTLNALRLVRPAWFVEEGDMPVFKQSLLDAVSAGS